MKKIKQKINDIRLQNKLVIIYVVTGLIPLIVLFVFAYCQMRNILMDRDLKSIKGAIEQSVTTVDGQIEVYDNLSNYITFNDTLSGVLSYDYKSTYEMYNQIVTTFDPMLSSLKYFHNDINRVTIYVDKAIKHDTTIAPIEEIKDRPFYNSAAESTKIQWFVDEDSRTLVSARKMSTLDQLGILGIMYIDVDYDSMMSSFTGGLEQSVATVDGQIEVYDNLSNYITFNDTLSGVLSYDYKSTYEMYNQIVTTFDPMLSSLKYFHNDINRVTIYVDKAIKHDTTIAPIEEIKDRPFYNSAAESTKIQWFVDEDSRTLVSARKMSTLDQLGILGIMYIDVDYDSMMSSFTGGLEQNCGMVVLDADGKVICSSDTFENNNTRYRLNSKKLLSLIDGAEWDNDTCGNTEGYSVVKKESSVTGWTVYVYEPRKLVLRSANSMITMIVVAFVVAVAGAAAASIFTTGFITRRINKLKNSMAKVENGDFDAVINTQDKDEIGDLIHSFNSMTTQIKNLITQVYEGRISQKESEMRALRAQINPHFLYNSLSLINWKAIEYEQEDISEITLALSNYYRTSLNKGKNILSFEQELSNMQSYLKIQQIMHDNSFDVVINVSEEVMPCESLNLILQPLVENAIDHGIDLLTDRKGIITVEARMQTDEEGKKLVCVTVSDNGVGMDKETAQNFLTVQSKGYGARNVNDRIRLYYGESYHLEVQSIPDEGTTITIKFPAKPYNTKN